MNDNEKREAFRKINRVMDAAKRLAAYYDKKLGKSIIANYIDCIQLHFDGYAEPGYSDPACGVIATGDWNVIDVYDYVKKEHITPSTLPRMLGERLEALGVEIEWYDEWTTCYKCNKLVRTSPDSYYWQPSFADFRGDCLCCECMQDYAEDHLKDLEDDHDRCNTIETIEPSDYDYVKYNEDEYETGWHPGQNDNSSQIAKELRELGIHRFLFNLDKNGQFDIKWSVYVHSSEAHLLKKEE